MDFRTNNLLFHLFSRKQVKFDFENILFQLRFHTCLFFGSTIGLISIGLEIKLIEIMKLSLITFSYFLFFQCLDAVFSCPVCFNLFVTSGFDRFLGRFFKRRISSDSSFFVHFFLPQLVSFCLNRTFRLCAPVIFFVFFCALN